MRARAAIAWIGAGTLAAGLALAGAAAARAASDDFAAGMRALEAERYEEAREALGRAVEADPMDGRALLLLGISELALGDATAALRHLEAARRMDPSLEETARAHEALARAHEALARARSTPPRPFRLESSAGLEFEDNVSVPEIDASSGRADGAFVADLAASYRLLDSERSVVELGYDFGQSLHFEERDADQQWHSPWIDGAHAIGALDAGLGYRFSTSTLGGDGFLNLHELRPRLGLPVRPGWTAELAVAYRNKDFLDSRDRDRDAHHVTAGMRHFFRLPDARARADAELRFEAEDARGAEFDWLGLSLGGGLRVPFAWHGEWSLDLGYRLRLRDYSNATPSIGEARLDLDHRVGVGLARRLSERVEARLDYRFSGADSNLPAADFVDNTLGLRLRVSL